eukprot:672260_1
MASCPVVPAYRIFQACNNCGAVDGSGCMDQILWVTLFMKNHTHNRNLNTRTDLEFSGKFAQKVPTNLGDQTAVDVLMSLIDSKFVSNAALSATCLF